MKTVTFALIKPDAVKAGHTGSIIKMIEEHGFEIVKMEKRTLDRACAEKFYAVHKERPFFSELVDFIVSGSVVALALKKENAVQEWRALMGATNPSSAAENTIRKLYGTSIGSNAAHGSDAAETATYELGLFFPDMH